jgi:hypothetical protein
MSPLIITMECNGRRYTSTHGSGDGWPEAIEACVAGLRALGFVIVKGEAEEHAVHEALEIAGAEDPDRDDQSLFDAALRESPFRVTKGDF